MLIVVGVVSAHAAFFFLQAATNVEDDIEKHALQQYGPWQGQDDLAVDFPWLKNVLREKISSIDWNEAADDVNSFLKPAEIESLKLWSERFFSAKLSTLG
ncbi:MAG: hypothetical protein GKR90_10655 [Pseudomonadales bacterium]|nr:hypothetical protein [Pseudomonadales bacterium]